MQSPRVYFNNIGSICTDSLRHGNGLSALLLLSRAAKSSAAKSSASKTRSMESRLYGGIFGYSSVCVYILLKVMIMISVFCPFNVSDGF